MKVRTVILKKRLLVAGLLGFFSLVASCGGSDGPSQTSAPVASTSSVMQETATSQDNSPALTSKTTEQEDAQQKETTTTSIEEKEPLAADPSTKNQLVKLHFESRVDDISSEQLQEEAMKTLNDPRGWVKAGFVFEAEQEAGYKVVLAEGKEVDALCLPLNTYGKVSCQNGSIVALNADRWRKGVPHWDSEVEQYRQYLVNHEVGHLLGQRHPIPRCPVAGRPAGVMEQQTKSLEGCTGNGWPRDWEVELASKRPVVYAPLPAWGPDPVPANKEPK